MKQIDEYVRTRATCRARTWPELAAQQVAAIDLFHQARQAADAALAYASLSREEQLDAVRQRDVRRREHAAIISRCDEGLRIADRAIADRAARRVVLAHRSAWFIDKTAAILARQDTDVIARLDNGADAVGTVIAEQPDVLLVEDSLALVGGEQVIREVQSFAPDTAVVAQVAHPARVGALLDSGARAVFTRQIPPAGVAQALLELLHLDAA